MLYNKNKFRKANDKKVLRKVGKQWKVVSIALLLALGGAGAASTTSVNAAHVSHHVHTERHAKKTSHHKHKSASYHSINKATNKALDTLSNRQMNDLMTNPGGKTEKALQTSVSKSTGAKLPEAKKSKKTTQAKKAKKTKAKSSYKIPTIPVSYENTNLFPSTNTSKSKSKANSTPNLTMPEAQNAIKKFNLSDTRAYLNGTPSKRQKKLYQNVMGATYNRSDFVSKKKSNSNSNQKGASEIRNRINRNVAQTDNDAWTTQYNDNGNAFTVPTYYNDNTPSSASVSSQSNSSQSKEASLANASINASKAVSASNSLAAESASNSARNASVASVQAQSISAQNASVANAQASQARAQSAASASASASTSTKNASIASASASASASTSTKNASLSASASASTSAKNASVSASNSANAAHSLAQSTKHSANQFNWNTFDGQAINANGLTQNVQDEVNSLEAGPNVQPVSYKANSAKKAPAKQAPIHFQSGDNGSAASYYNNTKQDQANFTDANAKVQSLMNQASAPASGIKGRLASASARGVVDQSLATSYANTAKQSNFSQKVSDIAQKAHATTSYYNTSVGTNFNVNSKAVSNGVELNNQLNTINSYAKEVDNINANASASNAQTIKAASANAKASSLKATLGNAKNALTSLRAKNDSIAMNNSAYNSASVADQVALINSLADNNYVNSLGASLNNLKSTQATIQAKANNFNPKAPSTQVNFKNASNVDVSVNANPGTSLNRVLSDTNAITTFGNYKAENALNTADAENAVSRANIDYASASSEAKVNQALANHPTLANVIANADGDYTQGMAIVNGKDTNAINSLATSASNSLANAKANSASYAKSTQADIVLAPSLATNYSEKANADSASTASANTDLNNFYSDYLGLGYDNANTQASNAKHALAHDTAFANAYGSHVYNFSPKRITVKKPLVLHSANHFTKKNRISTIKSGTELTTTGIGFAKDGTTRFAVSYNHHNGFVTANPNYVNRTYLFADKGNRVNVTAIKPVHEHKSMHFAKTNRLRTYKPGTVISGRVVSRDGVYGGFTRIQLKNGHYVTANTQYVKVNQKKTTHAHKRASNGLPTHLVNFNDGTVAK